MAAETLEERLSAVETELRQIKQQLAVKNAPAAEAGWEKIFGSFADSEGFDEATQLGREYREAQNRLPQEDAA